MTPFFAGWPRPVEMALKTHIINFFKNRTFSRHLHTLFVRDIIIT